MNAENKSGRLIHGIRIENPGIKRWKYELFLDVAYPTSWIRRTSIEGALPTHGPALVVANHVSYVDPPLLYFVAGVTAGRSLRMIARDDIVDPHIPERPRAGKEPLPQWKRHVLAFCASIGDPISVNRHKLGPSTIREAHQTLQSGQILAVSLTDTRKPENDLEDAMPLAALMAYRYPDVSVYPMGVSGIELDREHIFGPIRVKIGEPFTVNQLDINRSSQHEAVIEITEELKKRVAPLIPDYLKRTYMVRGQG